MMVEDRDHREQCTMLMSKLLNQPVRVQRTVTDRAARQFHCDHIKRPQATPHSRQPLMQAGVLPLFVTRSAARSNQLAHTPQRAPQQHT